MGDNKATLIDRKQYMDFITNMVKNKEKYKRTSDNESMVMAIDSAWGTGKSTFIEAWVADNKSYFTIVNYNAWENDFFDNPFASFVYAIVNSDCFVNDINDETRKDMLKEEFVNIASDIGKNLVKKGLSKVVDEETADKIIAIGKRSVKKIESYIEVSKKTDSIYEEYAKYKSDLQEFKNILRRISNDKNVVIIIDELDRCKPTFAIKLLEIVKHIFDCENITYIFAIDMEQLSHSVKKVYGFEMDASGYLCRFFDYISKMPPIDKNVFINNLLKTRTLNRSNLFCSKVKGNLISFCEIFEYYSHKFDLSLREIETIYNNFRIMENIFLKESDCTSAYALYLFFLIFKYKYTEKYNNLFINESKQIFDNEEFKKLLINDKYIDNKMIGMLRKTEKIKDLEYEFTSKRRTTGALKVHEITVDKIIGLRDRNDEMGGFYEYEIKESLSLDNVLFSFDVRMWEYIKEKTIKQHIQERMEVFDMTADLKKVMVFG